MIDFQKRWLVENGQRNVTLEGVPATVSGWGHEKASIVAYFSGVWLAEWETIEQMLIDGDRKFTHEHVILSSWDAWQGIRGWKVPSILRYHTIEQANEEDATD